MTYGVYKNDSYRILIQNSGTIILISNIEYDCFHKYVNLAGEINNNIFIKEVTENDLEDAYELNCKVIYKGREFDVSSSMANIIKSNKLLIGTLDYPLTEELGGFERVDKYYYEKEVSFDEIDKFLEVKKPLFHFKNTKSVTTREIPKDEIIKYALYIESFA